MPSTPGFQVSLSLSKLTLGNMVFMSDTMNLHRTVIDAAMLGGMAAIQWETLKSRKVIISDTFPPLHSLGRTYLGAFTWTNNTTRYMKESVVTYHAGLPFTPSDIARTYLTYRYWWQKRRTTTQQYQYCFCPKHKSVPLYAIPSKGDFIYVDLKAAYWNILLSGGWDVDYSPGRFIGMRSHNGDFPLSANKLARNILVSIGLPRRTQVWTGKKIISIKGRNKLYNGILWCFVQDVLHSIAQDMIDAGALYVHTDGYIFPAELREAAYKVGDDWGMTLTTKYAGQGEILGAGNYWIEGKPLRRPRPTQYHETRNVLAPECRHWLRSWMSQQWARRVYDEWGNFIVG